MATNFIVLTAIVLVGFLTFSRGCSEPSGGYKPPTLDWKMFDSVVVAHGVTTSKEKDPRHLAEFDVYSVEFELRCIYKGGPLNEVIRIDDAGYIPGHCYSTDLTVGQKYIVYLKHGNDGRYVQSYSPDPGDEEYLEEIVVLCETDIKYPKGYNKTHNKEQCPEEYNLDDCLQKPVVTTPTPENTDNGGYPLLPDEIESPQPTETHNEGGDVPYSAVLDQDNSRNEENGSMTLTMNMCALTCFLLTVLLL